MDGRNDCSPGMLAAANGPGSPSSALHGRQRWSDPIGESGAEVVDPERASASTGAICCRARSTASVTVIARPSTAATRLGRKCRRAASVGGARRW